MNKHFTLIFAYFLGIFVTVQAQEQLLVDENFQSWTNASPAASTSIVTKSTLISNESLNYSLWGITVANSGYQSSATANSLSSSGYLKMAKNSEVTTGTMSIELSPLKSITKLWFVECTSGSNRGFSVFKKNATDADWVPIHTAVCSPNAGMAVELTLNDTDVAIKFTNLSLGNYAWLTDLKIWGNVSGVAIPPVVKSLLPAHASTIPTSGLIVVNYSEKVSRVISDSTKITLGGIEIPESNINIVNDTVVNISYSGLNTDSSYELIIPDGSFINDAGTVTASDTKATYKTPDTILPTLSKLSVSAGASMPVNGFISLVMSEACKTGSAVISIGTRTISAAISASNSNLVYINYSGLDYDTDYTVTIPENAITDLSNNSYAGISFTFHTEVNARGEQLFSFTPDATTVPSTSTGIVNQTINNYALTFDGVASAGARAASPYTYAFKCNYVQLAQLPSVGELSFYIQSGGGTVPQEYYIQKLAADGTTWNTIETFIIGTNDKTTIKSAAAQSSVPTTLRLMYNSANFWFYNIDVSSFTNNATADDGLAPTVSAYTPAVSSNDVVINGNIKLVFSENVQIGAGDITLDGKTLTPSVVGKNVTLPYSNLKYSTTYTLNVPAGSFKDLYNNDCEAFSLNFTTKNKPAVTPKVFDFVVANDGSGNGSTIQSAFDAVPVNNSNLFTVFVKNGTYEEYPTLAETKNNVSLIGQSKEGVIITGNHRSGVDGYTTSSCQTLEIMADNFYCENMSIQNTAGVDAGQAVALKVYGDKAIFKNVKLTAYQDTHLTSNIGTDRQYYLNCDIRGSVDFIFGDGVAYFDNCMLYVQDRSTANVICAPATSAGNSYGYVFNNCTIDGAGSQDGIYSLGRPWKNAPRAVYLNTKMNIMAAAAGWASMSAIPALFAEYGTINASNYPVSLTSRNTTYSYTDANSQLVSGSSPTAVLSPTDAADYTLSNVLTGADSWDASAKAETTAEPSDFTISDTNLNWSVVDGAICYVVTKDGLVTSITSLPTVQVSNGLYTIKAVSEFGALSNESTYNVTTVPNGLNEISDQLPILRNNFVNEKIEFTNAHLIESIEILNVNGQVLNRANGDCSTVSMANLSAGFYLIRIITTNNKLVKVKVVKR